MMDQAHNQIGGSKRCSKCNEAKPLSDFYANKANKDGLQSRCTSCHRAAMKVCYEKRRASRPPPKRCSKIEVSEDGSRRRCTKCLEMLPLSRFRRGERYTGGIRSQCSQCIRLAMSDYNKSDAGRSVAKRAQARFYDRYGMRNSDRWYEWKENNPDKVLEAQRRAGATQRHELKDSYVRKQLAARTGMPYSELPQELIEIKREQLSIRRLARSLKQAIKPKDQS